MKPKKPVLVVVAGPNGSGKTTLTEQVLQHDWVEGCHYINPDLIANQKFGGWNLPSAVKQAADYAQDLRESLLKEEQSIAFETVLSGKDKLDFVARAKELGYFVRVFFVGTNHPGINAARVAQRVMEGGHDVPIPKIISRYTKSIANCVTLIGLADRCYVYDNSVDGVAPRLMFKTVSGKVAKVYSKLNPWAQNILEVLD